MPAPLRIGVVVGERSGDILGAGLMQAIQARFPDAEFTGIGGEQMLAIGFKSLFDQERLAVMGLIEPLKRLPELLSIRRQLFNHFANNPPDLFIGIDSPDFNLDLELKLKQQGVTTVHYVSPSVWAWRQGRVHKIAKAVDLILTLFPFEADFYQQHGVPVQFVGHPLADELAPVADSGSLREALAMEPDSTYLALLPGSREAEVRLVGPLLWQAAALCLHKLPNLKFIVPAANSARLEQIHEQLKGFSELPITVVAGQSQQVMAAANAVVMASGTTTLEALLLGKPMVVAYRMAWLSYKILSKLVKSKYISLPNLLADQPLVPELIQHDATPEAISAAILPLLIDGDERQVTLAEFDRIRKSLALNASTQAASAVLQLIGR
ncbi:lipid-A-disaccharide synthase [Halioxenophilus sp. WMMB6]|uniref:lipid-A-disaccharide synthase n=1 Tax=Halioxenophilus sp. WMMB6 TaxID=3073815 RepID=UPI00295EEB81|nr:lipid-A-disaccharide synthase [Halioxenophilus sp. WMMB6]